MEHNPNSPYIQVPTVSYAFGFKAGAAVTETLRLDSDYMKLVNNDVFGPRMVIYRGERLDQRAHKTVVFLTDLTFVRIEHGTLAVLPQNVSPGLK